MTDLSCCQVQSHAHQQADDGAERYVCTACGASWGCRDYAAAVLAETRELAREEEHYGDGIDALIVDPREYQIERPVVAANVAPLRA